MKYRAAWSNRRIFTSFFAYDLTDRGEDAGYALTHFPLLLDFFERISTDNVSFKKRLDLVYGLPDELIEAHRMPFSPPHFPLRSATQARKVSAPNPSGREVPLSLLYSGRLSRQFQIHVIVEAVSSLVSKGRPVTLDIWGESFEDYNLKVPEGRGIRLMGSYDGIQSLNLEEYDLFLFPALRAGLPNVLLECMGNGLPAIASNVGGVAEIVNSETGWLVGDRNDAEAFKDAISRVLRRREAIREKGLAAQRLIETRHTWEDFKLSARRFYGIE